MKKGLELARAERSISPRPARRGPSRQPPVGILLPVAEYERSKWFFDAAGATFDQHKLSTGLGYLSFPPGTQTSPCPVIAFPNGTMAAVVMRGGRGARRLIANVQLGPPSTLRRAAEGRSKRPRRRST